jgi:hypothetical protein
VRAIEVARAERRKETSAYGAMAQDTAIAVVECGAARPQVSSVVGVLDLPYDSARGLVAIAEASAERVLEGGERPEGCKMVEVSYWVRDQEGGGDFVVRYPASPEHPRSLWWVPDEGAPQATKEGDIGLRVVVDRLLRAVAYFGAVGEDLDTAATLVERATALDPANPRVAEVTAELLSELRPEQAIAGLERFIEAHGPSAGVESTLAGLLLERGDAESAARGKALLDKVLSSNATHPKALALEAERRRDAGDLAGARKAYDALLAAHPAQAGARYNLATLLAALGEPALALDQLDHYLRVYPEDTDALFRRAALRLDSSDRAGAEADLAALRRLAPGHPDVDALASRLR